MDLVVFFSDEDKITYNIDDVVVGVEKLNKIEELLKNKTFIKEELELEKSMFSFSSDDMYEYLENKMSILLNGISKKKLIKNLKKYLETPLELKEFKSLTLVVEDIDDLLNNKEFIENYEKPIFIDFDKIDINEEMLKKLKTIKFVNEPLVKHQYNNGNYYLLSEFLETLNYSIEIKKVIEEYKLSTLEKLMFIYDYLKDRVYKKDKIYENSSDLNKVVKGDSIVCSGFVNIFSSICNFLGIHTEKRFYYNDDDGHVTNICYVNDEKYKFNGVLEFDVTWDSKKEKNSQNEDNYSYFGLSLNTSEKVKEKVDLLVSNDYHITDFERIEKAFKIYKSYPSQILGQEFMKKILSFYTNLKNYEKVEEIKDLIGKLLNEDEEINLDKYMEEIKSLKNNGLDSETFLKVFLQTRRIEHYLNPKKYIYDEETIFKVLNSKYKRSETTNLLISIFGESYYQENILKKLLNDPYFSDMDGNEKEKLKLDKERLELANVITKISRKGR